MLECLRPRPIDLRDIVSDGVAISEGGIAISTANAGFGPNKESAVRLQLMPLEIGWVKPRDVTARRYGQRSGQETGEVHRALGGRLVKGWEHKVRDRHAIDVIAIDNDGIAYFDEVANLLAGRVRIEISGLDLPGPRRVNQHLQ